MKDPALFDHVNALMVKWAKLEKIVNKVLVKREGLPLTTERVGGSVRLCYFGKPVSDCKTQEKIEAVGYLAEFRGEWFRVKMHMVTAARDANAAMDTFLETFKDDDEEDEE